jgi:hypothetical protein
MSRQSLNTKIHFQFKSDGTFEETAQAPMPSSNSPIKTFATGLYKLEGQKLTLTMQTIHMWSDDKATKANMAKMNQMMSPKALKKVPPVPGRIGWHGKDSFVLTMKTAGMSIQTDFRRDPNG